MSEETVEDDAIPDGYIPNEQLGILGLFVSKALQFCRELKASVRNSKTRLEGEAGMLYI